MFTNAHADERDLTIAQLFFNEKWSLKLYQYKVAET
jgi:hypothetical protein